MDQLSAMRAFLRVVETGSFTRASSALGMPKATVSTLIQNLETHLRTKLLNRTTRRVMVTTDGALYYERAIRILAEIDELDGSLSHSQSSPSGRLRVEMAGAFADHPRAGAVYSDEDLIDIAAGIDHHAGPVVRVEQDRAVLLERGDRNYAGIEFAHDHLASSVVSAVT